MCPTLVIYVYTVCSLIIRGNKNIHTYFVRHIVSLQTRTIQDNIESMKLAAIDFICTLCNDCIQYSAPTLNVKLDISPLHSAVSALCYTQNTIRTFLFTTFCTWSKNISVPSVHPEPILVWYTFHGPFSLSSRQYQALGLGRMSCFDVNLAKI